MQRRDRAFTSEVTADRCTVAYSYLWAAIAPAASALAPTRRSGYFGAEVPSRWGGVRQAYKREPEPGELERYEFWLRIERRRGFNPAWLEPHQIAELEAVGDPGPSQDWPSRPIPDR